MSSPGDAPTVAVQGLLLGGQVHNSSSSSRASIDHSFRHAAQVGASTVLAPVSWSQFEPNEGRCDVTLVDAMLDAARRHRLRLVPLWFGATKNGTSTYAPRWVRRDRDRFPRALTEGALPGAFSYRGATPKPVLSIFSPELRAADARAFSSLMRHLAEVDTDGTVVMVQVENETGLLGGSRDLCTVAEAAWRTAVPDDFIRQVASFPVDSLARCLWEAHGARTGDWGAVFGHDSDAAEVFMAWGFATYVNEVAACGRAAHDVPMYANAWLGPQPGQENPGEYPSGGPASRVLDVWRAAAPTLDFVAPDIYVHETDEVMRTYAAEQDLFVPECRPSAAELVRAIGGHSAIGWSVFGIDDIRPDGQIATTMSMLRALGPQVAAAQAEGRIAAVVLEPGEEVAERTLGGVAVQFRPAGSLFRRMLLDAGVRVPEETVELSTETTAEAAVSAPADPRPFALAYAEGDGALVVVGTGVMVDVAQPGEPAWEPTGGAVTEIDSVEELVLQGEELVIGRILNGDERLAILPWRQVGAARIRLLRP